MYYISIYGEIYSVIQPIRDSLRIWKLKVVSTSGGTNQTVLAERSEKRPVTATFKVSTSKFATHPESAVLE